MTRMSKAARFALAKLNGHTETKTFRCGHTMLVLRFEAQDRLLLRDYVTKKALTEITLEKSGFRWHGERCPACAAEAHPHGGFATFWRDSCMKAPND